MSTIGLKTPLWMLRKRQAVANADNTQDLETDMWVYAVNV